MSAIDLLEPPTQENFRAISRVEDGLSEHQYDNIRPHPDCQALLDTLRVTHSAPLTERLIKAQAINSQREGYPFVVFRAIRPDDTDEVIWVLLETLKYVMNMIILSEKGERWYWVALHIEAHESFIRASGDDFAVAELDRLKVHLRTRPDHPAIQQRVKEYIAAEKAYKSRIRQGWGPMGYRVPSALIQGTALSQLRPPR